MRESFLWRSCAAAIFVLVLLLCGCQTTPNRAPVSDISGSLHNAPPPPPPQQGPPPPAGPGYYTVKRGDTLYAIALQFGQDYRQLAAWNNLDASYHIHVDQVLRVAPPDASPGGNQAAAVPQGGVSEKPLGPPGMGPAVVAVPQAAQGGAVPDKTGPLASKQPYSDATLAEMSKPDSETIVAAPVTTATMPPAPAPADDEDNIGWIWPVTGSVIAGFSDTGTNKGINIAGKAGTPIVAAGNGTVLYVGNGVRGYGNLVVVKHSPGFISVYAHNSKILVTEQQSVKKGQKIAEMGDSDADQVELHFEIRHQGKPVDPLKYLPPRQ